MNKISWLDLLLFLLNRKGERLSDTLLVYDVATGDEYICDTLELEDGRLVLGYNSSNDE